MLSILRRIVIPCLSLAKVLTAIGHASRQLICQNCFSARNTLPPNLFSTRLTLWSVRGDELSSTCHSIPGGIVFPPDQFWPNLLWDREGGVVVLGEVSRLALRALWSPCKIVELGGLLWWLLSVSLRTETVSLLWSAVGPPGLWPLTGSSSPSMLDRTMMNTISLASDRIFFTFNAWSYNNQLWSSGAYTVCIHLPNGQKNKSQVYSSIAEEVLRTRATSISNNWGSIIIMHPYQWQLSPTSLPIGAIMTCSILTAYVM